MQNILFIAPNFPPLGGISVQRSIQLVKGLPEQGYRPIVLTVEIEDHRQLNSKFDEQLLVELEKQDTLIHRVSASHPWGLVRFFKQWRIYRLLWTFAYPWFWERFSFWPKSALNQALSLIDEHNIQIVYSSSAPYTAMELAYLLKKKCPTLKWVNDIRDPWTEHFGWHWPSYLHWLWSRRKEDQWMRSSDKIVVVSEEMKRFYVKRGIKAESQIKVLTNAY